MDKVWFEHYQKGVPYSIDVNEYTSVVALFEESCRKYASQVAYVNLGSPITYAELDKKSAQFATYLQQLGLKKGARVAIMMPNLLQYPIVLFGILRAGYIVVNTNPLYTSDEVAHQMDDSGAEAIIVLANFAKTVEKALPQTKIKHVVITQIGDVFPTIKKVIVNAVVKYIKKMVPTYHIPHAISFNEAMKQGETGHLEPVHIDHQSIAFLQYTGGTTGISKGAILTHGNMIANVLQASSWIAPLIKDGQDIIVTALPLYHIFSLTANCLTFIRAGAKNILITNPRDIPHFISEIKNSGFTAITGVNTLFNALLNHPKLSEIDFSQLKNHPGEVCFPGGHWQEGDKDLLATAFRELQEELNIASSRVKSPRLMRPEPTLSGFLIYPWFATIESLEPYDLNPEEVIAVFNLPFKEVKKLEHYQEMMVTRGGIEFKSCQYTASAHFVWGATARIMKQLCSGNRGSVSSGGGPKT